MVDHGPSRGYPHRSVFFAIPLIVVSLGGIIYSLYSSYMSSIRELASRLGTEVQGEELFSEIGSRYLGTLIFAGGGFIIILMVISALFHASYRRKTEGATERLKKSATLLSESQRLAGMGSFEIDGDSELTISESGRQLLGFPPEVLPKTVEDCLAKIHPDDRPHLARRLEAARSGKKFELELRYDTAQGSERTLLAKGGLLGDTGSTIVGYFVDVTSDRLSRERLLLSAKIYDSIVEGVTITDAEGNILMVNRAFTNITGYEPEETLGKTPRILKSDHQEADFYTSMWKALLGPGQWEGEIWNRRKNGSVYPEWLSISAVRNGNGETTHYVAVFRDLTEIKTQAAKIDRLSYHDGLTDLPNRMLFLDRLETAIRVAERQGNDLVVLYLDLDRFKYVNTTYGYRTGDKILKIAANRILSAIRRADTVARVGGDEFLILLSNIGKAEYAISAAESILDAVKQPLSVDGAEIFLSASIGIAFWPSDGMEAQALVASSNAALNIAKDSKAGGFHVYTSSISERIGRRMNLEVRLRRAIEREEFVLYYQPRICARKLIVRGMEALVRWRTESGELIPPGEFIPLAEETGLIVPIGEWVLYKALETTKAWRAAGHDLVVSVNLSARQFGEHDVERLVEQALAVTGYPAERLELEITESLAMADVGRTTAILTRLSTRGVQFSLDDFGTGYSSLYYLKRLPIQWLKIDQSFVRDVDRGEPTGSVIVSTIIAMAKNLGLGTIAEGCETKKSFDFLTERDCDQIQGFFFSRPLPAAAFDALLQAGPDTLREKLH